MGLTMKERKAVTAVLRMRYRRAGKKEKGRLLDELVGLTGYNRCYAVGLLGGEGTRPAARPAALQRRRQRARVSNLPLVASALRESPSIRTTSG